MTTNNSQNNNRRKVTLAGVLSAQDQARKSTMYVVWSEGKPVSILKAKRGCSLFSTSSDKGAGTPIPAGTKSSKAPAPSSPVSSLPSKRKPPSPTKTSPTAPLADAATKCPVIKAPPDDKKVPITQQCTKLERLEKEYNALKSKEQEEQVELRRLRTENRLLRQRIDNLEKETATLADRLVQDQVVRAQKEEEMFGLKRELAQVKQHDAATSHKLVEANEAIQEFKRSDSAMSTSSCGSHQEETIHQLEEELMQVRLREAESCSLIRELRDKIRELESMNRQLQKEPCQEIQVLQEELIASKLREAEATLSMKELRQKVSDLDKCWQKHLERTNAATAKPPSKTREQSLNEEVMTVRMREAEAMAELKEMKQKVMELETQNQICNRQIKRMDDENQRLKAKLEDGAEREKETKYHMTEMERKVTDLESKRKEDSMMCRIKDAEHTQTIAEMRQRIAELEIENQELVTAGQLSEKGECQELENKIADLQEEVMQLKMARKLQSLSSLALNHIALDTESDYDTDDLDATMAEANRSRLQGLEGLDKPMSHSAIRQSLQDLDSSEGEGLYNHDGGTVKRRTSKKKRRNLSKGDATKDTNGSRGESAKRDSVDEGASGEESESNTNGVCQSNGATENAQTQLSGAASPGEKDTVQVNGALYTDDTSTTSSSM